MWMNAAVYGDRIESESGRTMDDFRKCYMCYERNEARKKRDREREKGRQQNEKKTTTSASTCYKLWTEILCVNMHIGTQRQHTGQIQFRFLIFSAIFGDVSCHSLSQPMHSEIGHKRAFPHDFYCVLFYTFLCCLLSNNICRDYLAERRRRVRAEHVFHADACSSHMCNLVSCIRCGPDKFVRRLRIHVLCRSCWALRFGCVWTL